MLIEGRDVKTTSCSTWVRSRDVSLLLLFFFQAEDGIRDTSVTGVQTCALPIYQRIGVGGQALARPGDGRGDRQTLLQGIPQGGQLPVGEKPMLPRRALRLGEAEPRSEERGVGKECRAGGGREQEKREGGEGIG